MFPRDRYLNQLIAFYGAELIRVITGMRRSGKSSLLKLYRNWLVNEKQIEEKNIVYINFESLKYANLTESQSLYDYVCGISAQVGTKVYLLFDEIQNVKDWEKAVNALRVDCDCEIVLTGSNARLLSGELATLLAGRYVEIQMFPLSFDEFLEFRKSSGEDIHKSFDAFLRFGGLPGLHELQASPRATSQYLSDVFNSVLLKDVVSRNNIRDSELLNRIIQFIFDNVGSTFSAKNISDFLKSQGRKLGVETIYNYLDYLENAFVIERVKRFDLKGRKYLETQEKIYAADVGIRNSVLGYRPTDIAGILENLVYLNLRQKGFSVSVGKSGTSEVDFVASKDGAVLYVQVCYQLTLENLEREVSPLRQIKDNYPKLVLTLSDLMTGDIEGIKIRNLIDFLVEPITTY
ncbi:ATP-binding protein [Parasutterella sp.]|uniref:ATP-binding protein n=1 Tax=Parasutterella sp. TaxID=2049037 RepID=UPI00307D1AA2